MSKFKIKIIFLIKIIFIILLLSGCKNFKNDYGRYKVIQKRFIKWQGYTVEWGKITTYSGTYIPYIFILPHKTTSKKVPCIYALHGVTGDKWEWTLMNQFASGGNLSIDLLEKGYAIFAVDYRLHGERKPWEFSGFDEHFKLARDNWEKVFHETLDDLEKGIDFLHYRKEIDKDRIGIVGYSMGGMFSIALSSIEFKSIKTFIACVPALIEKGKNLGSPLDYTDKIKAKSLLLLVGDNDQWYNIDKMKQFYKEIPIKNKKMVVYNSTHQLPLEYVKVASKWIEEKL